MNVVDIFFPFNYSGMRQPNFKRSNKELNKILLISCNVRFYSQHKVLAWNWNVRKKVSGCYNFIPKKSKALTLVWSEYNLAIISLSQLFVVCSASRSKASVLSSNSCSDLHKWFTRWHPIKDRYLCWLYDTLFHSHLLIWLLLE